MSKYSIFFLIVILLVGCSQPTRKRVSGPVIYCDACHEPIDGRYVLAIGKRYHLEHFKCAICDRNLSGKSYFEHDGLPLCKTCYAQNFSPTCDVCGKPLIESFIRDQWGFQYHKEHLNKYVKCYSCARLVCEHITGGGEKLEDGRVRCNLCKKTAVNSLHEAQAGFQKIRQFMQRYNMELPIRTVPLRLVSLDKLRDLNPNNAEAAGRTEKARMMENGRERARKIESVYILYGLPEEHFLAIAAHEFGHGYLFMNYYPTMRLQDEEGLCELFEYLWLAEQKTDIAMNRIKSMEKNKDRIYGTGFRRAFKAYKQMGMRDLLAYVKRTGNLP